ncbi:MAG: NAD(P)H-binding protein [Chitinophagaceae bacterium]
MKYAITGAAGNISKPITEALLKAGHEVTVIGRDAQILSELVAAGAEAAIGSVENADFLKEAFKGADIVYTMVPPNFVVTDWIKFIDQVGENYAAAIKANNIRYVINLSSIGGHLPTGAGPVSGLNHVESILNELANVNIRHLRPGYFFHNFLSLAGMVKHMNIIGSNFGGNGNKVVMAHPKDIAEAAIDELLRHDFTGHSIRYIASDVRSGSEIAKVLGSAVGNTELPWVEFTDEQSLEGLLQAGVPKEQATKYMEMGQSMKSGKMNEDYFKHPPVLSNTKLEDFAAEFAAAYNKL